MRGDYGGISRGRNRETGLRAGLVGWWIVDGLKLATIFKTAAPTIDKQPSTIHY
jgi:hypothetical protein